MNDLTLNCTCDGVARLDSDDVRWLYHSAFYDHPLSGAVQWNGGRYWVQYVEFDGQPVGPKDRTIGQFIPSAYFLFELPEEQWAIEDRRHNLFRECVGTHCDYEYDETDKKSRGSYKPTGREKEFYSAYPPKENSDPMSGKLVAYYDCSWLSTRELAAAAELQRIQDAAREGDEPR